MALITDPTDLSQGTSNAVADLRFGVDTTQSGTQISLDSAGANLPAVADNDYIHVRGALDSENNGLYIVTDATPTTSAIVVDKISGNDPVNNTGTDSTAGIVLGDTTTKCSVAIIPDTLEIYLPEQGNLSTDGVTLQALYSFLKDEWKADDALIQNVFPMIAITPEQFEFQEDWVPADSALQTPNIQTKKLIRTGGWSEVDSAGITLKQYAGIVTLGSFEDETPVTGDNAYYAFGSDATVNNAVDFSFTGPVNEAIKTFDEVGNPDTWTLVDGGGGEDTATRATGSFVTDGFVVGGQVTIRASNTAANDGTYTLTGVAATTLTVATGSWDTAEADAVAQVAVDNRNLLNVYIRVRDADPNGKTYGNSNLVAIGLSALSNKTERFPLSNATDLKIAETDANVGSISPYTEIEVKYLDAEFSQVVDTAGAANTRDFGILIDVGTYSDSNGVSNGTTTFTSAGFNSGITLADYTGGTLIIWYNGDPGTTADVATHTISGTPTDAAGTLTIVLTSALTGSDTGVSFTMQRASPVTASIEEIYEKIQYQLRQTSDIDFELSTTVIGKTADALLTFVGDAITAGSTTSPPTNPNGGGTGVTIIGYQSTDKNDITIVDNADTARNFPFVAAGTISFNNNLQNDTGPAEYYMYFTYTVRTTSTTAAVTAVSGSFCTLTGTADLPSVADQEYLEIAGFSDAENNGTYQVTDASPTTSAIDITKLTGETLVADAGPVTITIDEYPVNSPAALLVDDAAAADITGNVPGASVAFDFDYDNNVQGGRTASTSAEITLRAIGTDTAQYVETTGTITNSTSLTFSLVSALERNYSNP